MASAVRSEERGGRGPSWLRNTLRRAREGRQVRVRERALESLRSALHEAGDQLSPMSVRRDPDHAVLREDPEWQELLTIPPPPAEQPTPPASRRWRVRTLFSRPRLAPPDVPERPERRWRPDAPTSVEAGPLPIPERPWGSPARRLRRWGLLATLSLAWFIGLQVFGGSDGMSLIAFVIFVFTLWRSRFVAWELVLTRTNRVLRLFFREAGRALMAARDRR